MIPRALLLLMLFGYATVGFSQPADSTQRGAAVTDSTASVPPERLIPAFRPRPLILPWEWQDLSASTGTAVFTVPRPRRPVR